MKSKKPGMITSIAIAAIGVVILCLSRTAAVEAAYPFEKSAAWFSRSVWTRVTGFFRGSSAAAENVRLRREVASLAMVRGDAERLAAENARLRRALQYVAKEPEAWVPAAVLSARGGAAGPRNTIHVDKGSDAGVRQGAVVAVAEGLVGLVTGVTPHTAEVLLVTDRSLKVACEISVPGAMPVRGVICGGSEDILELRYLPEGAAAPSRSTVSTSGIGGVFPKGIEIGALLEIKTTGTGEVQPNVDFSTLEDVFIRREK